MNIKKWLKSNTASLEGKTVLLTGSTGGIGHALCRYLAALGATMILLDRNAVRAAAWREALLSQHPQADITCVQADLSDIHSVKAACDKLAHREIDVLIHNAGAYSIPRSRCDTGLDNVFQINFASPYYITQRLLPQLQRRKGRVVIVGSIAHNYSKSDRQDVDFSTRKRASLVYGNAKRYLMYAHQGLFQEEHGASLAVTHPGISATGITAHYPKLIYALIKYPMKLIFMRPSKAALCVLRGVFESTAEKEWIGPRLWNVWGFPQKKPLLTADKEERKFLFETAQALYHAL